MGKSENLKRLLEVSARFHDYSFNNQLLIAMQRPDATRVAGFRAWKKLGRFVKKGEKRIAIIAPVVGRKAEIDTTDGQTTAFGFRTVYVFVRRGSR